MTSQITAESHANMQRAAVVVFLVVPLSLLSRPQCDLEENARVNGLLDQWIEIRTVTSKELQELF